MSRKYCMQDGKRFDMNHPKWPVKKDGEKYKILPRAVVEKLGLDLVPSVTTVLQHSKGRGLLQWAYSSAIDACVEFIMNTPDYSSEEDLMEQVKVYVNNKRNEAADSGSDIHKAFELWLAGEEIEDDYESMCLATHEMVLSHTGIDIKTMRSEVEFAAEVDGLKYGGTKDLELDGVVFDLKSTNGKRTPYLNECSQLVAYNNGNYREGLLANIYIDQKTLRPYSVKVWNQEEKEKGWTLFRLCYKLSELI